MFRLLVAGDPGEVGGGHGEDGAHDKVVRNGNSKKPIQTSVNLPPYLLIRPHLRRHLLRPDGAASETASLEINRQTNNVMNQAQISQRELSPAGTRELQQLSKRSHAGELPVFDLHFDFGGHKQVGYVAHRGCVVVDRGNIHVVAATVVLGAIPAVMVSSDSTQLQSAEDKQTTDG